MVGHIRTDIVCRLQERHILYTCDTYESILLGAQYDHKFLKVLGPYRHQ